MATVRSSTFTTSNGLAWTLDAGSWTHVTESGTFSVGPSELVQSNKGRASGTTSAAAVRRHHAGTSTFEDIQVTVNFVRSALSCKPGIILRATGSGTTESFYLVQAETITGKSTTYGLSILKCVSGTYTALYNLSGVTGWGSTTNTLYLAARIETLDNGNARIQAKGWATGSGEPDWVNTDTDVAGDAVTGSSGIAYVDNTTTLKNTAGQVGLYTEIDVAVAYQADYDDFTVTDFTWNQSLGQLNLATTTTLLVPTVKPTNTITLAAPWFQATLLAPSTITGIDAYVGAGQAQALYVGATQATKLYIGSTQVWP